MKKHLGNHQLTYRNQNSITLTTEQFNDFRQADMIRMMGKTSSPPPGSTAPMATLSGYTKSTITSESQAPSKTSRRVPKEMHQHIPFLRMTSIMTPSRDPSWLLSKPKVFMMLLIQILNLMMEISMMNNFMKKTNLLYILYWFSSYHFKIASISYTVKCCTA